jgi:hypothetical protein
VLEENATVEAQAPEDQLVVLHACKAVPGVPEGYVITVDLICMDESAADRQTAGVSWLHTAASTKVQLQAAAMPA